MRTGWTCLLLLTASPVCTAAQGQTPLTTEQAVIARSDAFCADIFQLLTHAAHDFDHDKGAFRTDDNNWVSVTSLPHADDCRVSMVSKPGARGRGGQFTCSWNSPSNADAAATGDAIYRQVRGCFRGSMRDMVGGGAYEPGEGYLSDRLVTFGPSGNGAEFRIQVSASQGRTPAAVFLHITATYRSPELDQLQDVDSAPRR